MADLQLCYFCGSGPDSSLGEYSVVPPDLDPSPDQQRSVVLCPDCRQKLTTVVQPVVEAATANADADHEADDPPADGTATPGDGDPDGLAGRRGDGEPGGDQSGDADPAGRSSAAPSADDGQADEPLSGADADGEPAGTTDEATAESDDPGDVSDGAGDPDDPLAAGEHAIDRSQSDDGVGAGDEPGSGDGPAEAGGEGQAGGGGDDGASGDDARPDGIPPDSRAKRDQPHADDELVGRNNEAYNKTLRLLQNREFPVERHEIEQVAANAYQLDPQEVSDAIDALINKGLISQEGAQLLRT